MAIAIIFGLLFSIVLTLGAVPLRHSLLFRVDFAQVRGGRWTVGGAGRRRSA